MTRGTVFNVTAAPDVADDMNLTATKRARFKVRKSGNAGVDVNFRLPSTGLASPVSLKNLIATYGSAPPNDYAVTSSGFVIPISSVQGSTINQVNLPPDAEVLIEVLPVADNLTESSVVRLELTPGSDYALGPVSFEDVLLPSDGDQQRVTTAIAISSPLVVTGSGNGYVVGSQITQVILIPGNPPTESSEGAFWWPRSSSGQLSPAIALEKWEDPISNAPDSDSAALGVNSSQMIVGWSGTPGTRRAVIKKGSKAPWINLNDKHLVHGLGSPAPAGWNLQEAIAINEEGSIVGNGTKGSSSTPRAFLLIRRIDES